GLLPALEGGAQGDGELRRVTGPGRAQAERDEPVRPGSTTVRAASLLRSARLGRCGGEAGVHAPTLARQRCEGNAPPVAVDGRGGGGTVLRRWDRWGGSAEIARRALDHREPLLARLERGLRLGDLLRVPSGDGPVVLLLVGGDRGMQLRGGALDTRLGARIGAAPLVLLGVLHRTLHRTEPVVDPSHVAARDLARLLPAVLDGAQRSLRGLEVLHGVEGLGLGQQGLLDREVLALLG